MLSDLDPYFTSPAARAQEMIWQAGRFSFSMAPSAPIVVMGIVNMTPDSFSDDGALLNEPFGPQTAISRGFEMIASGAQIIDVGGESTRPGALGVDIATELARVIPVISALAKAGHCVSVDTQKPEVMRAAIDAGASVVNDVYALRAAGALEVCAKGDVGVVLMHMQGEPATMQIEPRYDNVLSEVSDFLLRRVAACERAGIASERIVVDPGFGFGKTLAHNIELTRGLSELVRLGYPVLAGWSRKGTLGALTGQKLAKHRVTASVAAAIACVARGAMIVRVHDVRETVDGLKVWRALGEPG